MLAQKGDLGAESAYLVFILLAYFAVLELKFVQSRLDDVEFIHLSRHCWSEGISYTFTGS